MLRSPLGENIQKVGLLAVVPELLGRLGAYPLSVLAAMGPASLELENSRSMVPYPTIGHLLAAAADHAKCSHFGLLIGQRIGTASLGLVGQLMRNAPTVGVALEDFAAHQHPNAHAGIAYLLPDKRRAFFGYAVYQPGVNGDTFVCDVAAMAAFNIVRELARPDQISRMEVLLSRADPLDSKPYRRLFGVKLHFNADQTAALLPRKWLSQQVAGADAELRSILERRVEALWQGERDIEIELRRALRVGLLSGRVSGDEIAVELGVNRRTLHRHLSANGLHFQQILDEVRCRFAQQLLADTRLGIGEIGLILRYSDASGFTRAFIRWTGVTPSVWQLGRQAHGG